MLRPLALLFALVLVTSCSVDGDGDGGDGSGTGDGSGMGDGDRDGDGDGEAPDDDVPEDGVLSYMDVCDVSDDRCDADADLFCFNYTQRGSRCTHECTSPDQCADPSPGCNGKGVCKAP